MKIRLSFFLLSSFFCLLSPVFLLITDVIQHNYSIIYLNRVSTGQQTRTNSFSSPYILIDYDMTACHPANIYIYIICHICTYIHMYVHFLSMYNLQLNIVSSLSSLSCHIFLFFDFISGDLLGFQPNLCLLHTLFVGVLSVNDWRIERCVTFCYTCTLSIFLVLPT